MPLIEAEGRSIFAESFGNPEDPALLLIAGMTSQLTSWPAEFCEALVDRGFFVRRIPYRPRLRRIPLARRSAGWSCRLLAIGLGLPGCRSSRQRLIALRPR